VKAKDTGHKFSIIASAFDPDAQTELKQDAVDIAGNPLPPEYADNSSTTKKGVLTMTAPVRPNGVQAFGKEKWAYTPTIASTSLIPTTAEATSASGIDLSGYLYADGFDGVTAEPTRNTAPRRLADTQVYDTLGTTSFGVSDLNYAFDPQAAALSNGKKAYEKLPEGTSGYLIRRLGIDRNTDFATGQFVDVIPVTFGPQTVVKTGTDESAEVAIRQAVRSEWRALKEKHPPRTAPEDAAEADARWGVNLEAVEDDLVYACLVSPQFKSRQAFDEWVDDELGASGLGACAQIAFLELLMAAPDPKSRPALPTLNGGVSDE
jgi:hypothetical protein